MKPPPWLKMVTIAQHHRYKYTRKGKHMVLYPIFNFKGYRTRKVYSLIEYQKRSFTHLAMFFIPFKIEKENMHELS